MTDVMVIGFPKSGTSSMHEAFRRAGMSSAHWKVREGFCGQLIYRDHRDGKNPLQTLGRFRCIAQADVCRPGREHDGESLYFWPQLDFEVLDAMRRFNPELRFILNRRDVGSLIRSISGWGSLRRRLVAAEIPGLPAGAGADDAELRDWIEDHYATCLEHFGDSANFLVLDIEAPDARERLSRFVGEELPWWGVANRHTTDAPD
jgi:hypothetical protein